jgi:hypothetical protein
MKPAIDLNEPEAATKVGGELSATTSALVVRLGHSTALATVADLEQAVEDRRQIGDAIKSVEAFFEPLKRMANQLHKALCARENGILGPLRKLDEQKRQGMSAFKAAQDRERRAREQALAEEQRREREARAISEAGQLEHAGEHAMAAAVVAEAIAAPPPVVALPDPTKGIEGLHFRRTWKWRYVGGDKARALALLPRAFLMPDESKIAEYGTRHQESAQLPGVEFFYEDLPVR